MYKILYFSIGCQIVSFGQTKNLFTEDVEIPLNIFPAKVWFKNELARILKKSLNRVLSSEYASR